MAASGASGDRDGTGSGQPEVRLAELMAALSLATDLGTGQPLERGLRGCLVAIGLGRALNVGEVDLADLYYLNFLMMVGCTSDSHVAAALLGDELSFGAQVAPLIMGDPREMLGWMLRHFAEDQPPIRRVTKLARAFQEMPGVMGGLAQAHCEVAQILAGRLGFGTGVQAGLGAIYARWDGRGRPPHLKGEAIPPIARLVHLAWDLQLFHRIGGVDACLAIARRRAGHAFDPAIVAAFCARPTEILAGLEGPSLWDAVIAAEPGPPRVIAPAEIDTVAEVFADFADMKSRYLHGHARRVGDLAATAAGRSGLGPAATTAIRRAALVQDLGRVAVPTAIWDKPGPLSEAERERVRLHAYHTERILARARPLAPLAAIAAAHHERLDGSGYHRGSAGGSVGAPARLLAAADVYAALTEDRPHRPAFSPDRAAVELRREVQAGRIDGPAADAVLAAAGHRVRTRRRAWPAGLSTREVEVLRLVARGLPNRAIARNLIISEGTVHHHVQHIYNKLGVSTRAAAALFASQHDLLDPAALTPE